MMIQRIQTIYLLFATIMTVVFLFVPFGFMTETMGCESTLTALQATDFVGLLVPIVVGSLLAFVAIFMFKRTPVQKLLIKLSLVSVLAAIGVVLYVVYAGAVDTNPDVTIETSIGGGGLLLCGAVVALVAAHRGVTADEKLLRSYDRIR